MLATLAGTHLRASDCGLREKWQGMFHAKDAQGIRAIQEALKCCGFGSTKDMAWPFPGQGRGAGECVARAEGVVGRCLDGLRGEERKVGWMLLAVPVGVFVWKVSEVFLFLSCSVFGDSLRARASVIFAFALCLCYIWVSRR